MTASHFVSPVQEERPRRSKAWILPLLLVLSCVPAILYFREDLLGVISEDDPEVRGQILWSTDDLAVQLGPGGWITHPGDGGDYVARNVRRGETWTIGDLASQREITADGVVIQPDESRLLIQRKGSSVSTEPTDILDAHGDEDLWPGEDVKPVAVSDTHVAVLTCLGPEPARLGDADKGGTQVLAGVDLTDASIAWTRDTGVACGPETTPAYYPKTLPAQDYVLVRTAKDQAHVVDIDTGRVTRRWSGVPARALTVHGDHVLEPRGDDAVAYTSLRSGGKTIRVECPGARAGDPGDLSGQLAPTSTPFVECRDTVHLIDGTKTVDVGAPPAPSQEPIGAEPVAVGRVVVRRVAEGVELRDGLTGRTVGVLDVPEDFQISAQASVGRIVTFVAIDDEGERNTADYRVFDSATGDLVLASGPGMRTGGDATPEGEVMVERDDEDDEDVTRLWVAGTKEKS